MRWYRRRTGYDSAMAQPSPPSVQVFGLVDDQPTRAALRFFKERRFTIHFVDLRRKPIAAGELRRFTDRLGARAVLDAEGRAARDAGLGYLRLTDAEVVERLLADQRLLRLPLVRYGNALSAGRNEVAWKAWLAAPHPRLRAIPAPRPPATPPRGQRHRRFSCILGACQTNNAPNCPDRRNGGAAVE